VLEAIDAADAAGLHPIKIDAVVKRGMNENAVIDLARRFRSTPHIVRFIEYMDVGNTNQWQADEVVPGHEIVDRINAKWPIEPAQPNYFGEVAERWRYIDGAGEIGVITSVTQPFCGSCTRARLSSDGEVFTCLFASSGFDIRARIRDGANDDELADIVANIWRARDDRYSEIRASAGATKKVEMFHIGG